MYAFTVADWALARSTPSKYKIITLNNILDKNEVLEKLQPGDLIYEGCDGSSTHVMLYAGNFTIIHAKCTDCGPIVKEPLSNRGSGTCKSVIRPLCN
jgi:cell wall-associated NlpC family hydrolase